MCADKPTEGAVICGPIGIWFHSISAGVYLSAIKNKNAEKGHRWPAGIAMADLVKTEIVDPLVGFFDSSKMFINKCNKPTFEDGMSAFQKLYGYTFKAMGTMLNIKNLIN